MKESKELFLYTLSLGLCMEGGSYLQACFMIEVCYFNLDRSVVNLKLVANDADCLLQDGLGVLAPFN